MKQGIHPEYMECTVKCSCGNTFTTRSTKPELKVDICNACHPFYTGQQKFVDTGGRVQRFADKFGSAKDVVAEREAAKKAARAAAIAEAEAKKQGRARGQGRREGQACRRVRQEGRAGRRQGRRSRGRGCCRRRERRRRGCGRPRGGDARRGSCPRSRLPSSRSPFPSGTRRTPGARAPGVLLLPAADVHGACGTAGRCRTRAASALESASAWAARSPSVRRTRTARGRSRRTSGSMRPPSRTGRRRMRRDRAGAAAIACP